MKISSIVFFTVAIVFLVFSGLVSWDGEYSRATYYLLISLAYFHLSEKGGE